MLDKTLALDAQLPQTQCTECGFEGCKPYAKAMACGEVDIDLCPPGGTETLYALANILKKDPKPYEALVEKSTRPPATATIIESECIGCTKCIQACPVDAIVGSNKQMHSVLSDACTGCRLCVEPCPVDCIEIVELTHPQFSKDKARRSFEARKLRLAQEKQEKLAQYQERRNLSAHDDTKAKQAYIMAALKRKNAQHE